MILNRRSALTVTAFAALVSQPMMEHIDPVVMVSPSSMPQTVPEEFYVISQKDAIAKTSTVEVEPSAVALYHQLRKEFDISHTEMSGWLGVKRRSLYNWMAEPEKATKLGPQIEERLMSLFTLREEMEPEHRPILFKIAFSPIYGDPKLGKAILDGANTDILIEWYDQLFSRFESYRSMHSSKKQFV